MSDDYKGGALCNNCGLCCDGHVFATVDVEKSSVSPLKNAGFELNEDSNGGTYFSQPCIAHEGNRCVVYNIRPENCKQFQCILLKNYLAGYIEFDDALSIVQNCRKSICELDRDELYKNATDSPIVSDNLLALNRLIEDAETDTESRKAYAIRAIRAFVVHQTIRTHFKSKKWKKNE
jgi:hypothetical protein